jgi:hypothetical protein
LYLRHQAMSDFFLSLIPDDPTYVPPVEAQAQAVAALRARLPPPSQVEARVFDAVKFIDQGCNFEKVLCPACDEDITEHWAGWMDAAFEANFRDLSLTTPCCGRLTNLNALRYVAPAGFALLALRHESRYWRAAGRKGCVRSGRHIGLQAPSSLRALLIL